MRDPTIPPVTHTFIDAAATSYHSYMIQARAASSSAAVLFRNSFAEVIRDIQWHRRLRLKINSGHLHDLRGSDLFFPFTCEKS